MSIMPEGGWGELNPLVPQQRPDTNQSTQNIHPGQPDNTTKDEERNEQVKEMKRRNISRASMTYPVCKICDRGTLSSKKVYRMSGPAVAIGFILLIPSILGMISCALVLVVSIGSGTIGLGKGFLSSRPVQPSQSAFDASFRHSCARSFKQSYTRLSKVSPSNFLTEAYCECALSTFKETDSETISAQTCLQRTEDGTLNAPSQDMDALYSDDIPLEPASGVITVASLFSGVFSIIWGITFFVGGLLGWLLVMKKNVLQCNVCGAVVNAS